MEHHVLTFQSEQERPAPVYIDYLISSPNPDPHPAPRLPDDYLESEASSGEPSDGEENNNDSSSDSDESDGEPFADDPDPAPEGGEPPAEEEGVESRRLYCRRLSRDSPFPCYYHGLSSRMTDTHVLSCMRVLPILVPDEQPLEYEFIEYRWNGQSRVLTGTTVRHHFPPGLHYVTYCGKFPTGFSRYIMPRVVPVMEEEYELQIWIPRHTYIFSAFCLFLFNFSFI